jgi:hypothetical protein
MSESATPAPAPAPRTLKAAPVVEEPPKCVKRENSPGSLIAMARKGATMRTSQIGCVHTCILDSAVMPKITSGMTSSEEIR